MKKLIAILMIVAVMLCSAAHAESIDLSGLSFQELAALRDRAQMEMMQRDEWQQVTVPQGVWRVGVDIPAGMWMVKCTVGWYTLFSWGDALDDSEQEIDYYTDRNDTVFIYNPDHKNTRPGDQLDYVFAVRDGEYIVIDEAPATFTAYSGRPGLGFK